MSYRKLGLEAYYLPTLKSYRPTPTQHSITLREDDLLDEVFECLDDLPMWVATQWLMQFRNGARTLVAEKPQETPQPEEEISADEEPIPRLDDEIDEPTPDVDHYTFRIQCAMSMESATQLRNTIHDLRPTEDPPNERSYQKGDPLQKFTGRAGEIHHLCPPIDTYRQVVHRETAQARDLVGKTSPRSQAVRKDVPPPSVVPKALDLTLLDVRIEVNPPKD